MSASVLSSGNPSAFSISSSLAYLTASSVVELSRGLRSRKLNSFALMNSSLWSGYLRVANENATHPTGLLLTNDQNYPACVLRCHAMEDKSEGCDQSHACGVLVRRVVGHLESLVLWFKIHYFGHGTRLRPRQAQLAGGRGNSLLRNVTERRNAHKIGCHFPKGPQPCRRPQNRTCVRE